MNKEKPSINEGLNIVEEAKKLERKDCYYEAYEKFLQASKLFKEIKEIKLSAKCQAAHITNIIKYYLATRDIEAFSPNMIGYYINKIDEIRKLNLNEFDRYDILISTYQELEGIFDKAYMKAKANNMYYEKTMLLSKYYWQLAKLKEKGKLWYRIKAIFSWLYHWYCGYGERPLRALLISIFFIFTYSLIFYCCKLIDYAKSSETNSIGWFQSLYFSIVTFTTLGFGDIIPTHGIGQIVVAFEVILGYLLLGTLVAILIRKTTR